MIAEKYIVFLKVGHTHSNLLSFDEQKCSGGINDEYKQLSYVVTIKQPSLIHSSMDFSLTINRFLRSQIYSFGKKSFMCT
jgi:hypothetical protein